MLSYGTPLPANGDTSPATHTYETPMRPFVTISFERSQSNGSVIPNHSRSDSHQASVYEEPLVSAPQYDSILGAQVRGSGKRGYRGQERGLTGMEVGTNTPCDMQTSSSM